ncbi:hypothetical protein GCM10023231_01760 [Olivibacter ginsenosidimutans]|uniref:Peptidase M1 membrane alanine aminopeptidase domain-containing protein n=2 Tax=Olivibacter ginsenosidimutans TaxID=1176537 RepID=A0ABP9AF18_9SPHI
MELYAAIDQGIRLPQQYARTGLMTTTICESFHPLAMLLFAYIVNDLYARSQASAFDVLENATYYAKTKQIGHMLSVFLLLLFFSLLMVIEGILFQYAYHYPHIHWRGYLGIFVFNTLPLLFFSVLVLLLHSWVKQRYFALTLSLTIAIFAQSPFYKQLIPFPLFQFFSTYHGPFSDFNGYDFYLFSAIYRMFFCFSILLIVVIIDWSIRRRKLGWRPLLAICCSLAFGLYSGYTFQQGYFPRDEQTVLYASATYEKRYKIYEHLPQPTITHVSTEIALYPVQHAYQLKGVYQLQNKSKHHIDRILINIPDDFHIIRAIYTSTAEKHTFNKAVSELCLTNPLAPGATAQLQFHLSFTGHAVNGHQSFNAIVNNGSFIRISRYFPQIGYQRSREIDQASQRALYDLGSVSPDKKVDAPRDSTDDFIHLDMLVSTSGDQHVVGTGELIQTWTRNHRNYFRYRSSSPIPFRFGLSSATYRVQKDHYKDLPISVYYHPEHTENVSQLIQNAKRTLAYCEQNFGSYPFHSLTFAEISSFTRGFAATAYPSTVFMTEDMLFHANVHADEQQDVIVELVGHELSHMWWGGNQIDPDQREGAAMLTETLAMYTEMMLYKQVHGREKMLQHLKVHEQIYRASSGFSKPQALYRVTDENTHISYSKGAVVMVKLAQLIGEDNVNNALHQFLMQYRYATLKPISTDLITIFLRVSPQKYHQQIRKMFMETL